MEYFFCTQCDCRLFGNYALGTHMSSHGVFTDGRSNFCINISRQTIHTGKNKDRPGYFQYPYTETHTRVFTRLEQVLKYLGIEDESAARRSPSKRHKTATKDQFDFDAYIDGFERPGELKSIPVPGGFGDIVSVSPEEDW